MALDLSIVVPLYNEEENVVLLYERIIAAVGGLDLAFEVLFVDDGSSDRTFERACGLAERDSRLKVVRFRRNYGQTPAMAAGIELAKGALIVTMDGDLQNDPTDIPRLLEVIAEGADLAVGWRFQRKDKLVTRKIPSRIANWQIGRVTGIPIRDNGCSLKAYRASVIKRVPLYSEMHRFIPAMTSIAGARVVEVKVSHHARQFGQSKYGLSRIYRVALDLLAIKTLTSFASRPIQWFAALALPAVLASGIVTAMILAGMARTDDGSLVIAAGVAMLLAATGGFYLVCGVLGALVFETGHVRPGELLGLTAKKVAAHE